MDKIIKNTREKRITIIGLTNMKPIDVNDVVLTARNKSKMQRVTVVEKVRMEINIKKSKMMNTRTKKCKGIISY